MTGMAKFFIGLMSGITLTVGGSTYYQESQGLPEGNNTTLSYDLNRSLFDGLPSSTYANNASSKSNHYPARWEWQMFGGLYDEGQDFTVAMQTCGERVCSSYSLRTKLMNLRRIKRKDAKYKWSKGQRKIELSHARFVAQDFIYKEEDVFKWCTAFGSLPNKDNPKYFYGWHCAPQGMKQNEAILDCVLESLDYSLKPAIRDVGLGCTEDNLAFTPYKPLKKKVVLRPGLKS